MLMPSENRKEKLPGTQSKLLQVGRPRLTISRKIINRFVQIPLTHPVTGSRSSVTLPNEPRKKPELLPPNQASGLRTVPFPACTSATLRRAAGMVNGLQLLQETSGGAPPAVDGAGLSLCRPTVCFSFLRGSPTLAPQEHDG